jgi:signal peptidase
MKALNVIRNIVVWLIVVIAAGMMVFTIVSVSTFDRAERSLFGYKAFIVLSDSMSKTDFNAGDLVLVKEVDPSTLQEGDIISYTSQNSSNYGEVVTHKIRKLTTDANGEPGFITYGTTTDTDDETIVTYEYVIGKYSKSIPKVGTFFQFLKSTPGYIVCILIPFLILILLEGIRCIRLFRKYKSEQQAELQAERDKIEADRVEAQRMMQELLQMKAQMAANSGDAASGGEAKPQEESPADSAAKV